MANNIAARIGIALLLGLAAGPLHGQHMHGESESGLMGGPLGIPHTRMGSGSAWLPDATPMRAYHWMPGRWTLMLHGDADLIFDHQFSDRGASKFGSTNWLMFMAMRPVAKSTGLLHLHAMASLEPLTLGGAGYPLLLQSGESWQGQSLHDRQHPHDLFVELAAMYEQKLTRGLGFALYGGPVGEPALGPVAFMHRPSAQSDPVASIAHHWQDATHITYGVVTGGLFTRFAKLEGSWFNGREPDEQRYNLDLRRPDSWSVRLLVNPSARWSASASYGYLKSPEASHPDQPERRFGAAVQHVLPIRGGGEWSWGLIWGASRRDATRTRHSLVAETNLQLDPRNNFFARATYVAKSAEDLDIPAVDPETRYDVFSVSAGYVRDLGTWQGASLGVGGRVSVNGVPQSLESVYGTRFPVGLVAYLRLRPALQDSGARRQMSGGRQVGGIRNFP